MLGLDEVGVSDNFFELGGHSLLMVQIHNKIGDLLGKEYPVIKVEVSSASHPFFTGKKLFVDTAGRVEKFKNKYQKKA